MDAYLAKQGFMQRYLTLEADLRTNVLKIARENLSKESALTAQREALVRAHEALAKAKSEYEALLAAHESLAKVGRRKERESVCVCV
jgi:hypothetical protein